MKRGPCEREYEIVRALLSPSRPLVLEDEQRRHASECGTCSDVMTLVAILRVERDEAFREVHVPAAGQVWWRAAVRSYAERAHAARRPLVWLQGIAGASAMGLIIAAIGLLWPSMREVAGWILMLGWSIAQPDATTAIVGALGHSALVALAAVVCLVVAPLVVYIALSGD